MKAHDITQGVFLNKTINFIGLGLALYGMAGMYQYLSKDPIIKHMIKCRYCRKKINEKVRNFLTSFWFRLCGAYSTRDCPAADRILVVTTAGN